MPELVLPRQGIEAKFVALTVNPSRRRVAVALAMAI